jgi:NAD(P)-dependent dehydrogenase (short-subunit alcohol dehydrogenase family)
MAEYVIAGGSRGIGLETVKRLAAQGNRITVLSRTSDQLGDLPGVSHVPCDFLSDTISAESLPDSIDGLAYFPGSINLRSFRSLKPDDFLADFQLNVIGAIRLVQAALPALKKESETGHAASVVFFSTIAVTKGLPMHASVATCKAGLEGLARSLAAELAPKIRVNCVAPALTDTELAAKFLDSDEKRAAMAAKYPLKRFGSVDDIASATEYLLGTQSSWMTGQILNVDGGMSSIVS